MKFDKFRRNFHAGKIQYFQEKCSTKNVQLHDGPKFKDPHSIFIHVCIKDKVLKLKNKIKV